MDCTSCYEICICDIGIGYMDAHVVCVDVGNLDIVRSFAKFIHAIRLYTRVHAKKLLKNHERTIAAESAAKSVTESTWPGVTILRPLKEFDTHLESNLRSCFLLDYPNLEIILSVSCPDDSALPVVKSLIREFPLVDAKLIIGLLFLFLSYSPMIIE